MKYAIIVGFGLAGFHLARQLQKQGKEFVIISDRAKGASRNAGGVLNPTILKRYTLAWNGVAFFDHALPTYRNFEEEFDTTIFQDIPILHYFSQLSDHNNWSVAAHSKGLNQFLLPPILQSNREGIQGDLGYAKLYNVGKLDIQKMLDLYIQYLTAENLLQESFEYSQLKLHPDKVVYQGIEAKNIVFCEGFGLKKNPWFSYLPLTGSKGEFLHIRTDKLSSNEIIKAGLFIVPISKDLYWVGATFSRDDKTTQPTNKGKEWILIKLKKILKGSFEVVDHGAAIRPTVQDRRPLLGVHPQYKQLYVFNGLGTRGVLMGPLLATWLFQFMEHQKEFPPEVGIDRFETYFSNPKTQYV
ncbi:FAD-binding oxidoreductase [Flavobacteriaceae bacterium]|nr:FAD-binding oxidoreductase [Flavobacteriaceae bacterium]